MEQTKKCYYCGEQVEDSQFDIAFNGRRVYICNDPKCNRELALDDRESERENQEGHKEFSV